MRREGSEEMGLRGTTDYDHEVMGVRSYVMEEELERQESGARS